MSRSKEDEAEADEEDEEQDETQDIVAGTGGTAAARAGTAPDEAAIDTAAGAGRAGGAAAGDAEDDDASRAAGPWCRRSVCRVNTKRRRGRAVAAHRDGLCADCCSGGQRGVKHKDVPKRTNNDDREAITT
jgi:hypothetical protein